MDLQSSTVNNFIEGCKSCSNLKTLVAKHAQKHSSKPDNHMPFCVTCLHLAKDVAAHTRKHAPNSGKQRTSRKKSCSCCRDGLLEWHRQCDILENERQLMRELEADQDSEQLNGDQNQWWIPLPKTQLWNADGRVVSDETFKGLIEWELSSELDQSAPIESVASTPRTHEWHTPYQQPDPDDANVLVRVVVPPSKSQSTEKLIISEVDGEQADSESMIENATMKRKHSESFEIVSSDDEQTKKPTLDDLRQNLPDIIDLSSPGKY